MYVPVLATPENRSVQDSTEIIDFLEARHPDPPVYPETPVQRLVSLWLEVYGDEWLYLPAMHYRWRPRNYAALGPEHRPEHDRVHPGLVAE